MFYVGVFGHQSASLCRASQDYLDMTIEQSCTVVTGALYRPQLSEALYLFFTAVRAGKNVIGTCRSFPSCVAALKGFCCRSRGGTNKDARYEEKKRINTSRWRSDAGCSAPPPMQYDSPCIYTQPTLQYGDLDMIDDK